MNDGFVFPWKDIALALGAASTIGAIFIAWVRTQLSSDFAKKVDVTKLGAQIEAVETQMRGVPSHNDMRLLSERIGLVERSVAVVSAEIRGVGDGIGRLESDLRMVKEHLLNKEGRP